MQNWYEEEGCLIVYPTSVCIGTYPGQVRYILLCCDNGQLMCFGARACNGPSLIDIRVFYNVSLEINGAGSSLLSREAVNQEHSQIFHSPNPPAAPLGPSGCCRRINYERQRATRRQALGDFQ